MQNRNYHYNNIRLVVLPCLAVLFTATFTSATAVGASLFPPLSSQNTQPGPSQVKALDLNGTALLYNKEGRLGTYNESITYFDKALAISPNDVYALTSKGLAIGGLGKDNESLTYYDKALSISPNDVYALTSKGLALGKLGRYNESLTYYDKALSINPMYSPAVIQKALFVAKAAHNTNSTKSP